MRVRGGGVLVGACTITLALNAAALLVAAVRHLRWRAVAGAEAAGRSGTGSRAPTNAPLTLHAAAGAALLAVPVIAVLYVHGAKTLALGAVSAGAGASETGTAIGDGVSAALDAI